MTGAGISAASGLPTYRGLGAGASPDFESLEELRLAARQARPNPARLALARLYLDALPPIDIDAGWFNSPIFSVEIRGRFPDPPDLRVP